MRYFLFIFLCVFAIQNGKTQTTFSTINGITMICGPDSLTNNPYSEIANLGANWACIVPYRNCSFWNYEIADADIFGWWGLSLIGIEENIKFAQQAGLKILLKPQLYLENSWPGIIDFKTDLEWKDWERQYTHFIHTFLDLAIQYDIEMFCIGAELKQSILKRKSFWSNLISDIRKKYNGKIIYSANWDAYENVSFWDKLDYIGISSYFPLSENKNADVNTLTKKWKPIVRKLQRYANKKGKQILFTEYGYLSVDKSAFRHWEHEERICDLNINELAQANALKALYSSWMPQDFWAGGFLWKWYPNKKGHQGYLERDYTPQGKLAQHIIKNWFSK